jgi:hypothetical protein
MLLTPKRCTRATCALVFFISLDTAYSYITWLIDPSSFFIGPLLSKQRKYGGQYDTKGGICLPGKELERRKRRRITVYPVSYATVDKR